MIETGGIIELTDDELRGICSGEIPAPEMRHKHGPHVIISNATNEYEKIAEEREYSVFEAKRAAFIHRYGVLQPDGTRSKYYID